MNECRAQYRRLLQSLAIPNRLLLKGLVLFCLLAALTATAKSESSAALHAAEQFSSVPHLLIQNLTRQILDIVRDADPHSPLAKQRALRDIERVLDQVVDFDAIARSVMGPYGNQKYYDQQKTKIDLRHQKEREGAEEAAKQLEGLSVEIAKRVGETETLYGSVTATEVAEALLEKGVTIDRRRIDLEGGIKTVGEHRVRVEFHSEVSVEIIVNVVPES